MKSYAKDTTGITFILLVKQVWKESSLLLFLSILSFFFLWTTLDFWKDAGRVHYAFIAPSRACSCRYACIGYLKCPVVVTLFFVQKWCWSNWDKQNVIFLKKDKKSKPFDHSITQRKLLTRFWSSDFMKGKGMDSIPFSLDTCHQSQTTPVE